MILNFINKRACHLSILSSRTVKPEHSLRRQFFTDVNKKTIKSKNIKFHGRKDARQQGYHQASLLRNESKAIPSSAAIGGTFGFGAILGLMQANPFLSQVIIATSKTSFADIIVQKRIENRSDVDWNRNLIFVLFGGCYLGVFQWFVYVKGMSKLFPAMEKFCNQPLREKIKNKAGIKALFQQIALDFTFIQPFMYFPVFYGFKTFVDERAEGDTRPAWRIALDNLKNNFVQDNFGMMAFWLPMDVVIYSVPLYLRLPLNHAVSFAWCCILSIFRGD